jgi:leader peptidase (prepilin peptidase)/N-methyltransferase
MQLDWHPAAAAAVFTLGGGWLAARTAVVLAGRSPPLPLVMAACGLLAAWAFHVVFGATAFLLSLCLAWALLELAIVDWMDFRLPDLLTLPLVAGGLAAAAVLPAEHVWDHAAAAATGYTVLWIIAWSYRRLRGQEGLGMGDAKLAAAAGAWLGLEPLPSVLLLASGIGILWIAVATILRGRAELTKRIPFGLPLTAAVWIVWLYGPFTFPSAG